MLVFMKQTLEVKFDISVRHVLFYVYYNNYRNE